MSAGGNLKDQIALSLHFLCGCKGRSGLQGKVGKDPQGTETGEGVGRGLNDRCNRRESGPLQQEGLGLGHMSSEKSIQTVHSLKKIGQGC